MPRTSPRQPAVHATIISQAAQIARLRRDLAVERARRAHPIPDDALEFVTATTADAILSQVQRLSTLANDNNTRSASRLVP